MKILEVKNNLVKISYTAQDNPVISGFVIIEDAQMPYVAQVMSLKADSGINYAIVKLLFTFNEEGIVKNYSGSVPGMDAAITVLSAEELLDILPVETPLTIGKLAQRDFVLNVDYSVLEKNLLVCSDNNDSTDLLLSNFAKQITDNNNKSIIFDTLGTVKSENKLVFGRDFKLPLNYDTINFIYEHDLGDVDPTSKAVIQDILLEVQEYSKTVLDKFIPFDSFISVVDAQYKVLQIPELALLKNRLLKYKEQNAFAQDAKDIHSLRATVRANLSTTIDLSSVDSELQKLIISTVYDEIDSLDLYVYSLVKIDSDNADKKLLKRFINQRKIFTTIFTSHEYKYLHELKERASNMIFFAPISAQHDFGSYNVFLGKLNADEFVIEGKATQNIPLILELYPIEELREQIQKYNDEVAAIEAERQAEEAIQAQDSFGKDSDTYSQETMTGNEDVQSDQNKSETNGEEVDNNEVSEDISNENLEEDTAETQAEEETEEADESTEPVDDNATPVEETVETPDADEQIRDENLLEEVPEEELEEKDFQQDNLPDVDESFLEEAPMPEDIPAAEQVSMEEVGFSEAPTEEDELVNPLPETEELTENDLDMIDTINEPAQDEMVEDMPTEVEDTQTSEEEFSKESTEEDYIPDANEFIEQNVNDSESFVEGNDSEDFSDEENEYFEDFEQNEEVQEEQPPVVPVYPAEETPVTGSGEVYNPGDRVTHPKYGEGVVEKMVKFGNKVLCAINFANGRRLLDPTISQIERL